MHVYEYQGLAMCLAKNFSWSCDYDYAICTGAIRSSDRERAVCHKRTSTSVRSVAGTVMHSILL